MATYADLVNANGTIYNTRTGRGYSNPEQLAADLGLSPNQINWSAIRSGAAPSIGSNAYVSPFSSDAYSNLVNNEGTIFNKSGGYAYSSPDQLARDLGIPAHQIDWNRISSPTTQQIPSTGTNFVDQLTPEYKGLYDQLKGYLTRLQQQGQQINPNITITPEKLAEFTKQAEAEVNPYYRNQLSLTRENLLTTLGYNKEELQAFEKDLERRYGTQLRQLGENAAEQGFAQSGRRISDEQMLAQETQSQLDTNRRARQLSAASAATGFAQRFGSSEFPAYNMANIVPENPRVLPGSSSFSRSGIASPFYSLSPDVYNGLIGSEEYSRRADVQNRTAGLEAAFRSQAALDQQRKITL